MRNLFFYLFIMTATFIIGAASGSIYSKSQHPFIEGAAQSAAVGAAANNCK